MAKPLFVVLLDEFSVLKILFKRILNALDSPLEAYKINTKSWMLLVQQNLED